MDKKFKIGRQDEEPAYLRAISYKERDIITLTDNIENVLFLEFEDLDKLIEILQQIKREMNQKKKK